MKPRLESAPATEEDSRIWWLQHWHQPFKPFQLMTYSLAQDRRDAELMLDLTRQSTYFGPSLRICADHWARWRGENL